MYKVLLVDDEALTRKAISQNIPWKETGFELVGTAENGEEALRVIKEKSPDLVLTDICMPVMDGLALSEHIKRHYPQIKVVIISGYDDFEYARQAIKYEVSNYILKPITSVELVEELKKIKGKIEESLKHKKEIENAQKKFEDNIPALRSHFLTSLLKGDYERADVEDKMSQLGVSLNKELQAVVMLEIEEEDKFTEKDIKADEILIESSVENMVQELLEGMEDVIFFRNAENKCILIFSENNHNKLTEFIRITCENMIKATYECTKVKIYMIVGEAVDSVKKWAYSYQKAMEAKEYKFLFEEQTIVYGQEVTAKKTTKNERFIRQIDHLILGIKLNSIEEIEKEVKNIFEELRQSGREKKQMIVVVQNLALSIFITLEAYVADKIKEYDKEDFILQLAELKHLRDMEGRFLEFSKKLSEIIADKRNNENQKQAIKAVDYIEKNYMNIDISLNMVCEYLCVSTSYFSALFKNATGETFIEALTRIRIKKAKELLESSNMKNYEIALAVGYQDPHYFSSIFKKHIGVTPTEYAKKLQKGK